MAFRGNKSNPLNVGDLVNWRWNRINFSHTHWRRETTRTRIKLSTWEQPCPADRQPVDQEIEQDNEIDTVGKSIEPSSIGPLNRSDGLIGGVIFLDEKEM